MVEDLLPAGFWADVAGGAKSAGTTPPHNAVSSRPVERGFLINSAKHNHSALKRYSAPKREVDPARTAAARARLRHGGNTARQYRIAMMKDSEFERIVQLFALSDNA